MSRIGRKEIVLPTGVTMTVDKNNIVTVKGPKGTLTQEVDKLITIKINENIVSLSRANEVNTTRAKHGLYRALLNNMVTGVATGFSKNLVINGVGFKANKVGNKLVLNIGLSHPVEIVEEDGIKIECPSLTEIKISGIDKQKVGQFAAKIRDIKPVEPYHAYGIKYQDEYVARKVGKSAGKGKK